MRLERRTNRGKLNSISGDVPLVILHHRFDLLVHDGQAHGLEIAQIGTLVAGQPLCRWAKGERPYVLADTPMLTGIRDRPGPNTVFTVLCRGSMLRGDVAPSRSRLAVPAQPYEHWTRRRSFPPLLTRAFP